MNAIGLIAATADELRMFARRLPPPGTPRQLNEHLWIVRSGIGADAATAAAERLLDAAGALALISWGTAGALAPDLAAGDLLLPHRVIRADDSFATDARWRAQVQSMVEGHCRIRTGDLLHSPAVVTTVQAKRTLRTTHPAIAVDMESAALAARARQHGLPFLVVRAIADPADGHIPPAVSAAIDGNGQLSGMRLLAGLCRHPGELPGLRALARDFAAARRTLAPLAAQALAGHLAPPAHAAAPAPGIAQAESC
ncbi:hypothetical protein [Acidihalobacter ferrooxydans]|uniref:Nucleoside phosphorylase domain-containing protein n=1 Tax=Acidihalobacter ferrooxydans TaxID=1765967 RepID=A0A1P8UF64_9GAMM|nr:hypothetical protein [Acidihalobacter ferrooxydans]APZ42476.1 hypothetical protein BW247_04715 [Acidihalobacter ferrooxydans]